MPRRRSQAAEPRAVVAAATRVTLKDKKLAKKQAARRQAWQEDAWEFFDLFGFVKQSLWLLGNAIAKAGLFVAVADPDDPDGEPLPITDPKSGVPADVVTQALAELARLKGPLGGLPEILRMLDMNLEVAGEGYLIGLGARDEVLDSAGDVVSEATPESWTVRSTSEVDVTGDGTYKVKEDPGGSSRTGTPLDPELDTCIRFWLRHPRFAALPDSAMRGELEDLETLLILARQRRAEGKSRLPSGLLLVDSNITVSSPVASQQDDGQSSGSGDPVLDAVTDAISDAIEDESSAAGLAPVTMRVSVPPGSKVADMVAKVDLSRTSDQWLDTRIDKLVESVARGLNLPVESVMGHQQTTFANAEQVDEDKYYDHLEPRLLLIVDLLTVAFLRPQLTAEDQFGVAPSSAMTQWAERLFVWYDPSALLSKADPEVNASEAHARMAISDASYRAAKGFGDDDAPDPVEVLIRVAMAHGRVSPDTTVALLDLLGLPIHVKPGEAGDSPGGAPAGGGAPAAASTYRELAALLLERDGRAIAAAAHAEPVAVSSRPTHERPARELSRSTSGAGRKLMDIDRELRTRLLVLATQQMTRALERAGNRARQRLPEARALVRRTDAAQVLRTLGPSIVAAGGVTDDELLDGAFDDMETQFMAWGAQAQHDALALASELGTGFTIEQRDAYALRQAEDLTEAWAWLKDQLVTLASQRMFDPAPDVLPGEFDPTLSVPPGLIRQAITRAGGTIGVQTMSGTDAWVVLRNGGSEPAGGIGTGELIRDALTSSGTQVEAYQWVYGPAHRANPFEEHVALDGQVVENFDDGSLDASDSWTPFGFYFPGDHAGCQCDVAPVIVDASALT